MPESPNRHRLAELMEERRKDLRLRWQDVAEASGLSLKTLHSVRSSDRRVAELTKTGVEDGLRWEHGSVDLILSGGDPVPLPAAAEAAFPPAPGADTPVPPVAMTEELERAARPHIGTIGPANLAAVARGWDPPGDQLFEPGSWEAETWERLRRGFRDPYHRLWVIAATLGSEDGEPRARHGAAAGLTAAGTASGRAGRAGGAA